MLVVATWVLFALGIFHCILGFGWFKKPILAAVREGYFGKFMGNQDRRLAFWFTIFGPMLMLIGQVSIYAVSESNRTLLFLIGYYLLAVSLLGALALPKSPFWLTLILSVILVAGGYGWVS